MNLEYRKVSHFEFSFGKKITFSMILISEMHLNVFFTMYVKF